jgi:hypothetical protein
MRKRLASLVGLACLLGLIGGTVAANAGWRSPKRCLPSPYAPLVVSVVVTAFVISAMAATTLTVIEHTVRDHVTM